MTIDRMKMAEKHEGHVAKLLGGHRSKASGSQWTDQADGRTDHTEQEFAFAWDCKSTLAKSHTITTEMLDKLEEQAQGERPMMPLRWYADDSLREWRDWVLILLDDAAEMIHEAENPSSVISVANVQLREKVAELEAELERLVADAEAAAMSDEATGDAEPDQERLALRHEVARLNAEMTGMAARARDAEQRATDAEAKAAAAAVPQPPSAYMPSPVSPPQRNLSPLVPQLPWTSVFVVSGQLGLDAKTVGVVYQADGHMRFFDVNSVRAEPYGQGKRLFVNEQIVRHGDLWIDGVLDTRVGLA